MTRSTTILILLGAAILEAAGDAVIRLGLHSHTSARRYLMFATAAIVLFAYGWVVNAPPWDFGKLLGLYVVFFFCHCPVALLASVQTGTLPCDSDWRKPDPCRRRSDRDGQGLNYYPARQLPCTLPLLASVSLLGNDVDINVG